MKFTYEDLVVIKENIHARANYCVWQIAIIYDGTYFIKYYGDVYDGSTNVDTSFQDELEAEPGTRSWRVAFQRYQESELLSLEEASAEWKRITESKSTMEKEFNAVKEQARDKMKQAADLVKEVNALISPLDKDLCNLTNECRDLALALDEGGWRQSNWKC